MKLKEEIKERLDELEYRQVAVKQMLKEVLRFINSDIYRTKKERNDE